VKANESCNGPTIAFNDPWLSIHRNLLRKTLKVHT
jgi:hypothetical protein